ncbi:S1C family serine protease [Aquipuribacter sp. MA13-6]|uniref:S1C family serine protease n=1 Tax=unclassified Aquipuribacter TaxID=2635084 RepID=UPI003EEB46DA
MTDTTRTADGSSAGRPTEPQDPRGPATPPVPDATGDVAPVPEVTAAPGARRRPAAWVAGVMAVALLAAAAGLVLVHQQLTRTQAALQALESRVGAAEEVASGADERLGAAGSRLAEVDTELQVLLGEQDESLTAGLDVALVVAVAEDSVVTVLCGDSLGSGFAVEADVPDGYASAVLTNHHVVQACTDGDSELAAGRRDDEFGAAAGPTDEDNDLALVYVTEALPPLEQAAEAAEVGDPVVAIGSPYGLEGTVTSGIVSNVDDLTYQTDAAVNPGNSGGPLLDREGRVLGVNTFVVGGTGLNFAVRLEAACEQLFPDGCGWTV